MFPIVILFKLKEPGDNAKIVNSWPISAGTVLNGLLVIRHLVGVSMDLR